MLFYLDNWQSVGPNSELALYGPGAFRVDGAGVFSVRDRRPRTGPAD